MKKGLVVLALASIFAACSDSASETESTKDSTQIKVDSSVAPVVSDSVKLDTSASKLSLDTTKK